jgi:hypothetical protein
LDGAFVFEAAGHRSSGDAAGQFFFHADTCFLSTFRGLPAKRPVAAILSGACGDA